MFKVYDVILDDFRIGFEDYDSALEYALSIGYPPSTVSQAIYFAF